MSKIDISKVPRTKAKTKDSVELSTIPEPRYLEAKLNALLIFMVKQIVKRYQNQIAKQLTNAEVKEFQDANYFTNLNSKSAKIKKQIDKQFNNKRLKDYIRNVFVDVNSYNKTKFDGTVDSKLGIDLNKLLVSEGLNSYVSANVDSTLKLVKDLKDETNDKLRDRILIDMKNGKSVADIANTIASNSDIQLNRAKIIARQEVKSFNSNLSKKRAMNLGVKKAIWKTSKDERVRHSHAVLQDKEYTVGKGLPNENGKLIEPGEEINCRCRAQYIVEFD